MQEEYYHFLLLIISHSKVLGIVHIEDCTSRVLTETFINVLLGRSRNMATPGFGPHDFTWVICDAMKVTGSARLFSSV